MIDGDKERHYEIISAYLFIIIITNSYLIIPLLSRAFKTVTEFKPFRRLTVITTLSASFVLTFWLLYVGVFFAVPGCGWFLIGGLALGYPLWIVSILGRAIFLGFVDQIMENTCLAFDDKIRYMKNKKKDKEKGEEHHYLDLDVSIFCSNLVASDDPRVFLERQKRTIRKAFKNISHILGLVILGHLILFLTLIGQQIESRVSFDTIQIYDFYFLRDLGYSLYPSVLLFAAYVFILMPFCIYKLFKMRKIYANSRCCLMEDNTECIDGNESLRATVCFHSIVDDTFRFFLFFIGVNFSSVVVGIVWGTLQLMIGDGFLLISPFWFLTYVPMIIVHYKLVIKSVYLKGFKSLLKIYSPNKDSCGKTGISLGSSSSGLKKEPSVVKNSITEYISIRDSRRHKVFLAIKEFFRSSDELKGSASHLDCKLLSFSESPCENDNRKIEKPLKNVELPVLEDFDHVISSPLLLQAFKQFCFVELNMENILFYEDWIEMGGLDFMQAPPSLEAVGTFIEDNRRHVRQFNPDYLLKTYIKIGSSLELNISGCRRDKLLKKSVREPLTVDDFEDIANEVRALMMLDIYPRFVRFWNREKTILEGKRL
jgi:hypothetical protein